MGTTRSQVDAILDRVRRVTQQTAESLKKELRQIKTTKVALVGKLDDAAERIQQTLSRLGIGANGTPPKREKSSPKKTKGKRVRRSPEQLKQEAEAIVHFIKSKGAEGAKGADVRKRYPKVGPDIKGFIQKFGGRRLKTTGTKATMRYHAS